MRILALLCLSIFIAGCPGKSGPSDESSSSDASSSSTPSSAAQSVTGPSPVVLPPLKDCPYYDIEPRFKMVTTSDGTKVKQCIYRHPEVSDYTNKTEVGRIEIKCAAAYGEYGFKLYVRQLTYCE